MTHIEKHAPGKAPRVRDSVAGLSYRSDVELGNPMAIPIIVFKTDLIAVTIRGVAEFFAKPFGIQVLELPFKIPPVPVDPNCHPLERSRLGACVASQWDEEDHCEGECVIEEILVRLPGAVLLSTFILRAVRRRRMRLTPLHMRVRTSDMLLDVRAWVR